MTEVHMIIGLSVVVSFLLLVILNLLRWVRGSTFPWARGLMFAASGLLLIQYVLGFSLLGGNHEMKASHYLIAFAAILPVGAEHMIAGSDSPPASKARSAFFASLAAFVLVMIAYYIGDANGS